MTKPLLLHIGYHKTATTWMQKHLFMPVHGFQQIASHEEVFAHIVKPHGLRFDPAAMRSLLSERRAKLAPETVPVISSEILSGHPFQGGHESDVYAERLKAIAPEARILISIRDQMRIIPSVYIQYLQRGGTMPWEKFFEGTDRPGYFGFTLEHFEYDVLVAHYQHLFGAENVYVMTQESLAHDMSAASAKLARFAGADSFRTLSDGARRVHAAGYPEYAAPLLRRVNHIQTSTLNPWPAVSLGTTPGGLFRIVGGLSRKPPFGSAFKSSRPISAYVTEKFAGRYTPHNARLAQLCFHPLDLTGYC